MVFSPSVVIVHWQQIPGKDSPAHAASNSPFSLSPPGLPTIWMMVEQGPIALAVGADGGLFGHFYSPQSLLSSFSLSLEAGLIQTQILSQRVAQPKTTNQPNPFPICNTKKVVPHLLFFYLSFLRIPIMDHQS